MDEELSQETREKIAILRTKVRIVVTYISCGAMILFAGWNLAWQGDGTIALTVVGAALSWVGFWFGSRTKNNDTQ